jgi:hypothetical protein
MRTVLGARKLRTSFEYACSGAAASGQLMKLNACCTVLHGRMRVNRCPENRHQWEGPNVIGRGLHQGVPRALDAWVLSLAAVPGSRRRIS